MNALNRRSAAGKGLMAVAAFGLACVRLNAAIIGLTEGTAAPGSSLGPFTITPFGAIGIPEGTTLSSLSTPLGGALGFSSPVEHFVVGSSWLSWSHGYQGDVYWSLGSKTLSLAMPADTAAFRFYAQPNPFGTFQISARSQDGTTLVQTVSGLGGASGYGFYGTSGDLITSVTITSSQDFAVGEFGIAAAPEGPSEPPPTNGGGDGGGGGSNVPDDGRWAVTLAMACVGGTNLLWRRRVA